VVTGEGRFLTVTLGSHIRLGPPQLHPLLTEGPQAPREAGAFVPVLCVPFPEGCVTFHMFRPSLK